MAHLSCRFKQGFIADHIFPIKISYATFIEAVLRLN